MTTTSQSIIVGVANEDVVPEIRAGALIRYYGNEAIAWSDIHPDPVLLDPVGSVVLQIIDGIGSVADLIADVHEAVGVERDLASAQIARVLAVLDGAGLLTSSVASELGPMDRDLFHQPPST